MTSLDRAYIFDWHLDRTSENEVGLDIPKYKKLMRAREFTREAIDKAVITLSKRETLGHGTHLTITTDGQLFSCSPFKQYIQVSFDSAELGWTGDRDIDKHE